MSATDELRRLLDERGVEYTEDHGYREFFWNFGEYGKARASGVGTRGLVQMIITNITPEQAVEATLGSDLKAENAKLRELVRDYIDAPCTTCDCWQDEFRCWNYDGADCGLVARARELGVEV